MENIINELIVNSIHDIIKQVLTDLLKREPCVEDMKRVSIICSEFHLLNVNTVYWGLMVMDGLKLGYIKFTSENSEVKGGFTPIIGDEFLEPSIINNKINIDFDEF